MRKILLLLTIAVCFMVVSVNVFASDAPTIVVSSDEGENGTLVDITVSLENNPGFVNMRLRVGYNSDVMTLTNVTDAGNLGAAYHSSKYTNPYILYWDNGAVTENYVVNDKIVTLTFSINDSAVSGEYPVTISYDYDNFDIANVNMQPVRFEVENGVITVKNTTSSGNTGGGSGSGGGTVTKPTISYSNLQTDEKISLVVYPIDTVEIEGIIIAALYDDKDGAFEINAYRAAPSVDVEFIKTSGKYIKLFWLDLTNLKPHSDFVKIDL